MSQPKKPNKHALYEASVQNAATDLDFGKRIYRKHFKRAPKTLREDFCGTAKLATTWVESNKQNQAWGIDLHQPTLNWGITHNAAKLDASQKERLHLICGDVLTQNTPPIDITYALNFSFCLFKERTLLRHYFKQVHKALNVEGLFVLDLYGGTDAITSKCDDVREIPGFTTPEGIEVPDFEYTWDQASYNPINHDTTCHIHFDIPGYGPMKKAFTYNWRLWTLMELQELLNEAGFSKAEVYLHDFDDEGESDEIYRHRKTYENVLGWVAYIVGVK